MLSCQALTIRFGGLAAIDNLDFQVAAGEIRGLIGPNGSGKSTLIRLLAGTLKADEGTISFSELGRKDIAYLPQKPYAFDLSVEQNVRLALDGLPDQERLMLDALDRVGLLHLRKSRGNRLSGGEMQRLSLARVIARPHKLLLLDEPTASADIQAIDQMERVLLDYCAKTGCTLIFSSHAPSQAQRLSTRTLALSAGKIAEDGETACVLQTPADEATRLFLQHWRI